jgi:hypothetical protein
MSFNYPKNWILVVKFLKTVFQPTQVGFVCVAAFALGVPEASFYSPEYYASVSREKEK